MIGVIAREDEKRSVRELFELLKIPWESFRENADYDVVVSSGEYREEFRTDLLILHGTEIGEFDRRWGIEGGKSDGPRLAAHMGREFPVYGKCLALGSHGKPLIRRVEDGEPVAAELDHNGRRIIRVGFNLFDEVKTLLSADQAAKYAHIPTLEIHIDILRRLMIRAGVPFVEVPPVPFGHDLSACLTHDIDFAGIRNHRFDHTMFGFLYRALCRTSIDVLRGKSGIQKLLANLKAIALLPAVHLCLTEDFWIQFEQYLKLENGAPSTFFFLPHKATPGCAGDKAASMKRAGRYDLSEVGENIKELQEKGCEIGLHGIDAWHDAENAREETARIASVTGRDAQGVRVHWLFFDRESPGILERAGLSYDSTCGYNDAVGFRAGTAQAFRPFGCEDLLELPLLIQDTAMFFPGRMNLGEDEAFSLCRAIVEKVATFGGVLVINWHDRSLAPERLWGDFYCRLLEEIRKKKVWFATGSEVTGWFRKRRRLKFTQAAGEDGSRVLRIEGVEQSGLPDLKLRLYGDWDVGTEAIVSEEGYKEIPLRGDMEIRLPTQRKSRRDQQDLQETEKRS